MEYNDNNNKNIDPIKTGKFIKELRLSHNWTQDELGDKIFISRKSVSKWETGKCCPSIDMLKRLSETLGVSFDDLIAGEFTEVIEKPKKSKEHICKFINNRKFRITWRILVSTIFLLLLLFFVYNYNSMKVYRIGYEDEKFALDNGVIIFSNSKNYIYLGDFYANFSDVNEKTTYNLTLYIFEDGNAVEILSQKNNKKPYFSKNLSYELSKIITNENIESLYLNITYTNVYNETKKYDLKLDVELDFMNNFRYLFNNDRNFIEKLFSTELYYEESNKNIEDIYQIDLTCLYNLSDENKRDKLNNKSIIINDEEYTITFNNSTIVVATDKITFYLVLEMNKIMIDNSGTVTTFELNDSHIVEFTDEQIVFNELLYYLIEELKSLL